MKLSGCRTKDEKAILIRHIIAIANPPGEKGILLFGVDDNGYPTGKLDLNIEVLRILRTDSRYSKIRVSVDLVS